MFSGTPPTPPNTHPTEDEKNKLRLEIIQAWMARRKGPPWKLKTPLPPEQVLTESAASVALGISAPVKIGPDGLYEKEGCKYGVWLTTNSDGTISMRCVPPREYNIQSFRDMIEAAVEVKGIYSITLQFKPETLERIKSEADIVKVQGEIRAFIAAAEEKNLEIKFDGVAQAIIDEFKKSNPKVYKEFQDAESRLRVNSYLLSPLRAMANKEGFAKSTTSLEGVSKLGVDPAMSANALSLTAGHTPDDLLAARAKKVANFADTDPDHNLDAVTTELTAVEKRLEALQKTREELQQGVGAADAVVSKIDASVLDPGVKDQKKLEILNKAQAMRNYGKAPLESLLVAVEKEENDLRARREILVKAVGLVEERESGIPTSKLNTDPVVQTKLEDVKAKLASTLEKLDGKQAGAADTFLQAIIKKHQGMDEQITAAVNQLNMNVAARGPRP
jgi:hypothetical protein